MKKKQTNKITYPGLWSQSLTILILTVTSFFFILVTAVTITGVIIFNQIQSPGFYFDLPAWAQGFYSFFKVLIAIEMLTVLILSIIFFIYAYQKKKMCSLYMSTCILNWILALFIGVMNIVQLFVHDLPEAATSAFGWVIIILFITLVIMDSLTYHKLNLERNSKK